MTHLKRNPVLILTLLLALTMGLSACGSTVSSVTPTATTAALVQGEFVGDAVNLAGIALSTNGQRVIAYLCDGTIKHISLAQWFKGAVTNNTIDLTNAQGGHLVATLTPQVVTGTITLNDGRSSSFTAHLLPNSGNTSGQYRFGLYRSEQTFNGVRYLGGWVLSPQDLVKAPVWEAFLGSALIPLPTCCNPDTREWGIINEQTGALLISPKPDFPNQQVTVPNLGTFRLTLCSQAQC